MFICASFTGVCFVSCLVYNYTDNLLAPGAWPRNGPRLIPARFGACSWVCFEVRDCRAFLSHCHLPSRLGLLHGIFGSGSPSQGL